MGVKVLATGGAGYIGSHVAVELMAAGHEVVILDNFENSTPETIERIGTIAGRQPALVRADVRDRDALDALFRTHRIDAVIHLAGKKAVGESVADPLLYYDANVGGAVALLGAMRTAGVGQLVFSSSATVYGEPETVPIPETARLDPGNPYGETKLAIEWMIGAMAVAEPGFRAASLRYFNPVGAHESALIGEDPRGVPNNLFPFIAQTAAGLHDHVNVFGDDYPTPDGTGLRDYIHVVDLARGHVAALDYLLANRDAAEAHLKLNLGTGRGTTVLEAIEGFSKACGFAVPYRIGPRRPGDVASCVADPSRAEALLGWRAERGLGEMCADHWAFQKRHAESLT